MPNRLLSLTFDPQGFEIAPSYDSWVAAEMADRIILSVTSTVGKRENFEVKFGGLQEATVKGLPDGDYTLHACPLPNDKTKISFAFYRAKTFEEVDRIIFDGRMFLDAFLRASQFVSQTSDIDAQEFETQFGMNYLYSQFGHRIDGGTAFWQTLEEDIDIVTTPINHALIRERQNLPEKPYFISFNNGPLIRI